MKSRITAPLAALLGSAALAACGGPSIPVAGGGADGGSSTADLVYGCSWLFESSAQTANVAYPDTNAVYWVAALPDKIPSGDQIEIAGSTPTARYSSFQIYTENGEAESGVNDAGIVGQGATPAQAVAPGRAYKVNIIYSATASSSGTTLVANPNRASSRAPAHKYLLYRLYLPTSGAADAGSLPALTYVAREGGRIALASTPDQPSCNTIRTNIQDVVGAGSSSGGSSSGSGGLDLLNGPALKPPRMTIYRTTIGRFQNLDVRYMREKTNDTLGDLLLFRARAPASAIGGAAPQVRYWSLCSDEFHAPHRAVSCLADQDARLGADGYYNVVMAPSAPPAGYEAEFNYLPWGADAFGEPIYRQLLADPAFSQSIDSNALSPLPSVTMGAYFPDNTYCSSSVFAANLSAGAAAVFAACKAAQGIGAVVDPGP
ncbi:MAG TPA: hypothetical protein VFA75_03540 [Nevskia sp.]|nr:hypothetical protein [Nevskia sp.]